MRGGHQGVLVAQSLGPEVGGGGQEYPGGQATQVGVRPLSEDVAATRHLQAAAPRPTPGTPLPRAEPKYRSNLLGLWCFLKVSWCL